MGAVFAGGGVHPPQRCCLMTGSAPLSARDREVLSAVWPVSRETIERLETFRLLLERWQAKTNLVSPGTLSEFWIRHVADSLLVKRIAPNALHFADLGTGGGFPGMVLAIVQAEVPGARHFLIESNQKKCAFLRVVARETGAAATICNERIESATKQILDSGSQIEIVTARALTSMSKLLDLADPFLAAGAVGLFHKGREYRSELEECNGLWRYDLVVHDSGIEPGSVLLEVRNPVRLSSR
jgi:16S rRNA (guanine527-N7)-methyltransferase